MAEDGDRFEHVAELFAAIRQAEKGAPASTTLPLLEDLVATLQAHWSKNTRRGLSERDFVALEKLGREVQRCGFHEQALAIYGAAREYARRQNNPSGVLYFSLRGVSSCVALLDLQNAEHLLSDILKVDAEGGILRNSAAAITSALSLSATNADQSDRHLFRIEALLALGSYLAASGKLGDAEKALRHLLTVLEERSSTTISTEDVTVLIAEVCLDRGDFASVENLLTRAKEHETAPNFNVKWRILESQLYHLQSRFSEANEILQSSEPELSRLPQQFVRLSALWQRFHILAALNRLDEAEQVIVKLAAEDPGEMAMESARNLLSARRSGASTALNVPPTPEEAIEESLAGDGPPTSVAKGDLNGVVHEARRTCERIRSEHARLFNTVLLALHANQVDAALLLCTHMAEWVATIDSTLIQMRQKHLWALVSYYCQDYAAAVDYATSAIDWYAKGGMTGEQWALHQIINWSLQHLDTALERREQNQQEMRRLQDLIAARLTPMDRSLYLLNKWSTVDDAIAAECRILDEQLRPYLAVPHLNSYQQWREGRATRKTLKRILAHRQHYHDAQLTEETTMDSASPSSRHDVYRLALDSICRRTATRSKAMLTSRISPRWLPTDTAILHYLVLPNRIELFVIGNNTCRRVRFRETTSRQVLWGRVAKVLADITQSEPLEPWKQDSPDLNCLAESLGFSELESYLPKEVQRLVIIPDDILAHVPFAAIPIGTVPCIARFSVSLLPTLSWTEKSLEVSDQYEKALGVGVTSSVAVSPTDDYEDLYSAVDELNTINKHLTNEWTPLLDHEATHEAVNRLLPETELAHFACHGEFFSDDPESSGLLLYDKWLTLRDLYILKLDRLTLVTLSSCWGASTTILPGSIHIGLPFALLDRGTQAVLASLWGVEDRANVRFVKTFYDSLAEQGPIAALATTQSYLWQENVLAADWAGYTAYIHGIEPRKSIRLLLRLLHNLRLFRERWGQRRKGK